MILDVNSSLATISFSTFSIYFRVIQRLFGRMFITWFARISYKM